MERKLRLQADDTLCLMLLGILVTIVGYQFGLGNQTEHMPLVLRALDPAYLVNDFYVESASQFGPRYYYVQFLAFFSQWIPFPAVVFSLVLLVNFALVTLTFLAVRDLLGADRLAGFIAAILVVSVSSFPIGLVTDIRFIAFQSAGLAIPGCLAAVWAGLRGKGILAASLAAVSCLAHPLYGTETGAVAITTALFVGVLNSPRPIPRAKLLALAIRFLAAVTILGAAVFTFWVAPQFGSPGGAALSSRELIDILAYFRSPHHYIASDFPIEHYIALFLFLVTFVLCWRRWRELQKVQLPTLAFLIPPALVLLGCFAGYLLLEIWPTRVGMIAQPFRILYLVKWLGLLFLGWLVADWIKSAGPRRLYGLVALLGGAAAQTVIAFLALVVERIDHRIRRAYPGFRSAFAQVALLAVALVLFYKAGNLQETMVVVIGLCCALPLAVQTAQFRHRVLPVAIVASVVIVAVANRSLQAIEWRAFNPIITWADHRGDDADASRWALDNTPVDSVFLIPPGMGTFRLLARRAVVVDFEAIPFEDSAMREWRKRIRDSYGNVATTGFEARDEMELNYGRIDDRTMDAIATGYGAEYAVLHAQTQTDRAVLYANPSYKIVALTAP